MCENACCNEDSTTTQGPKKGPGTNQWSFCDNDGRFDPNDLHRGGEEVNTDWAKTQVMNYRTAHEKEITGFLFSKKVFDHIFNSSDTKINMVRFDLILNSKTPYLIARGVSTDFSEVTLNGKEDRVFINQSMCPADCNMSIY